MNEMKKIYYRYGNNKHFAIYDGNGLFYQRGCMWYDLKHAKVGTKKEMNHLLQHDLYQYYLRGARVVDIENAKFSTIDKTTANDMF